MALKRCVGYTEARRHHARVQRVGLPLPATGALAARAGGSEGSTPGERSGHGADGGGDGGGKS